MNVISTNCFASRFELLLVVLASLCGSTAVAQAQSADSRLADARAQFQAGDLEDALKSLEPFEGNDNRDGNGTEAITSLAVQVLHARGEEHFRNARITECIADFDRELALRPDHAAHHWQRGIALYYAGEYTKGAEQFELHRTANPQDVENAAWHFLCKVREPDGSVEVARQSLIAVTQDARAPMPEIQRMFAGEVRPEAVLQSAARAGKIAQFYADLYVGLFYEALGDHSQSIRFLRAAAANPAAKGSYMGDVARVHVALRTKSAVATNSSEQPAADEVRKIFFLAGGPSHGYGSHDHFAGCKLLAKSLANSGLPIETTIHRNSWPADAHIFDDVDCIVVYADGGAGHLMNEHLAEMDALAKRGVGLVCLHYAVEVPKGAVGNKFLEWIGGYFEQHWSVNPHWTANYTKLPEHPITRGVKPFRINDEWYYHMRFRENMRGVTPILTDIPPAESLARPDGPASGNPHVRAAVARREPQHTAWAVEREDGGRGFGFTGGHVHWNWADPNFRKLVLNAIVWCAKGEVPRNGVTDQPKSLPEMEANIDEPVPADFKREAIRSQFNLAPAESQQNGAVE